VICFLEIRQIFYKKKEAIHQVRKLSYLKIFFKKLIEKTIFANRDEKLSCRICLNNDNYPQNPLISPCSCKGTLLCIHFNCLQSWLLEKVKITKDDVILIYVWEELRCELCKEKFVLNHLVENKRKHLMDANIMQSSYVLFESIIPDENMKYYLFFVSFNPIKEIIVVKIKNN